MSSFNKLIKFLELNPNYQTELKNNDYFSLYFRCRWSQIPSKNIQAIGELLGITSNLNYYYSLSLARCTLMRKDKQDKNVKRIIREFEAWGLSKKTALRYSDKKMNGKNKLQMYGGVSNSTIDKSKISIIYGYLHDGGVAPMDRYARYKENW